MTKVTFDTAVTDAAVNLRGADLPSCCPDEMAEDKMDNLARAVLNAKDLCPEYAPVADVEEFQKNAEVWALARLRPGPTRIPELVNCVKTVLERDIQPEAISGVFY